MLVQEAILKIIWRKKEFLEFIRLKSWALGRRRVDKIPAHLQPIGFGFSIVKPIRQGFWIDEETNTVYIGFLYGLDNFHYVSPTGQMRSSANWPEPALKPLSFQEGYFRLSAAYNKSLVATDHASD
jgi:hypothetical protein